MIAGTEFLRVDSGFILTNEILLKMQIEDQKMYRNVQAGYERKKTEG